ncbi:NACHT domain-containing protein [Burkholderia multivorans]|uniref:NACHT domain-containing protein n=1 Tax=Burkholderia multivorans TaxID=87883 RepID=UPI0021C11909|nr:NTPase [Burkholderia multivorans]
MTARLPEDETDGEFEQRGVELARALHDPSGVQGSLMINGRERDGVFVSHEDINAYEFTLLRTKDKAEKDAAKLVELLNHLSKDPENSIKPATGWFVTREEPTADQRTAVATIARKAGRQVHAISIAQMYKRICNSEMYIQGRDKAPFGSVAFTPEVSGKPVRVPVRLVDSNGGTLSTDDVARALAKGHRTLIVGDYGAGKSHALRDIYSFLRKDHFRHGHLNPFPIHINLRDCVGLRTPAEILRRHAEEIGFDHANGLISAWRAGLCVLLLDGFDEVLPTRWLGSVTDLKRVRWEALAPIRRLVDETPASAGVVVAGRSHYFSGQAEMTDALGFKSREVLSMVDFDEEQLADYLRQSGATWTLPDWVPTRPLLLGYLVSLGKDTSGAIATSVSREKGWRAFLDAICVREAKMFTAVRPEIISQILSRVATIARGGTSAIGPISTDQLRAAFVSVNGFQPDEEGIQVLLRLPGLTASFGPGGEEMRSFADEDLAETAYGLDLAAFVLNPYDETNPLASPASWVNASSGLGGEVAAGRLLADSQSVGVVSAAITKRQKAGKFDAVLADLLTVVAAMPSNGLKIEGNLLIAGVAFEELQVAENPLYGGTTFQDCLIERLDMSGIDEDSLVPHFQGCVISHMEGLAGIPEWLKSNFANTEVERFSTAAQTTAGIMQLKIDRESRIALTVLKKVFVQRGSARQEGALSRGLTPTDRAFVPSVLAELVSKGWIRKDDSGGNVLYVGSKNRRKEALRALEAPTEFRLQ